MMSCFRCEVAENHALLGYYAASQFSSTVEPPTGFPAAMGQDISCPFVSFTSISTVFFCFPLTFFYYLPVSSPFSSFTPFSMFPFLPLLYYSDTSPPVLFHLGLQLRDYIPPLNFSVTELFIVLISFLPKFSPVLQSALFSLVSWP